MTNTTLNTSVNLNKAETKAKQRAMLNTEIADGVTVRDLIRAYGDVVDCIGFEKITPASHGLSDADMVNLKRVQKAVNPIWLGIIL
jgi:DUF438 domain-containing protein